MGLEERKSKGDPNEGMRLEKPAWRSGLEGGEGAVS